jgi:hypothetical protein
MRWEYRMRCRHIESAPKVRPKSVCSRAANKKVDFPWELTGNYDWDESLKLSQWVHCTLSFIQFLLQTAISVLVWATWT